MNIKKMQRELKQPFSMNDLEWRVQQSGIGKNDKPYVMALAYVTNRAIMNRLDEVVSVGGWRNEYSPLPNSVGEGALCGISIKIDDAWVTKYDGSDNTAVEATKGGLSSSMKILADFIENGMYSDTFYTLDDVEEDDIELEVKDYLTADEITVLQDIEKYASESLWDALTTKSLSEMMKAPTDEREVA